MNPEKRLRLRNVIRRILTFRRCRKVSKSVCTLARRGFFYNNEDDMIECHECGKVYVAWKDDINHYPFCQFDIEPYPRLVKMMPIPYQPGKFTHFPSPQPVLAVPKFTELVSKKPNELDEQVEQRSTSEIEVLCNVSEIDNHSEKSNAEDECRKKIEESCWRLMETHKSGSHLMSVNSFDSTVPLDTLLLCDMSKEKLRFNTFMTKCAPWPWRGIIPGRELARCGFYFCGVEDRVKCFSCGLIVKEWKCRDFPFEKHLMNSPSCHHIRKLVDLRNPFI